MSFLDKKFLLEANLETRSITEENLSSISFYNTDENIANLYMKLIYVTDGGLSKELQKDEVDGYSLKMTAIKPKTNQIREIDGVLSEDLGNEGTCAIFKFQLGTEFTNQIGEVICCTKIAKGTQQLNMDYFVYTIKEDKLTGLNAEIESNPDLPILKELIEEVKETAQTVNNIDNVNVSDIKTYSNKKIEEKFSGVSSQIKDIENEKASTKKVNEDRYKLYNKNIPKIYKPFTFPNGFLGNYKPLSIIYDGINFKTDFNRENFMYSGGTTYYIAPNGDWQNDGLTEQTPVKLYQALNRSVDGDTIIVKKGIYLIDHLDQNEYNLAKNLNLIAEEGAFFVMGGRKPTFTKDTNNNLWIYSLNDVRRIISCDNLDFELEKKSSINECKSQVNSWYTDGSTVYVNTVEQPKVYTLNSVVGLVAKNTSDCKLYVENLTVIGGDTSFKTNKSVNFNLEIILNKCKFLYNVSSQTSVKIQGGNILSNNCIVMYSKGDGFGYLHQNESLENVETNFVEINCVGANNGIGGTQDNMNGSTAHGGVKGIRVNGLYYNNFGANVGDVQTDTQTLNLGCSVFDSCATSMNQGFGLQQAGATVWLYNCIGYGNSADLVAYGNTTAYTHNCNFGRTAGGGTIIEI